MCRSCRESQKKELTNFLFGKVTRPKNDYYSLFTRVVNGTYIFVLVYVDDLLITGEDKEGIVDIEEDLHYFYH